MKAINIVDLSNAKIDVDHVRDFATTSLPTVTDRLGRTKRSLAGVNARADVILAEVQGGADFMLSKVKADAAATLARLGYEPPVAYVAGIQLIRPTQTVQFNGQTYAPQPADLPFSTVAIFEPIKFRLIQGASWADISAASGADGVGWRRDAVGAAYRTLSSKVAEHVSVFDFGAVGSWNVAAAAGGDDTAAFLAAVSWSRRNGRAVGIPGLSAGFAYQVNETLDLTAGGFYGASLIGENAESSKIITGLTGIAPLICLTGGSGTATNARIENLTLTTKTKFQAVALRLNGNDFVGIKNLHAGFFNYGLHLFNDTSLGTFTELTRGDGLWINYCNSNIRFEVGKGDASFHGTTLDNVFMNVGDGQIGLDIGPNCYVYNSRFNIRFWGGPLSTYIKNRGNCQHNFAEFTYEGNGKLDNVGRFHANGWLDGIGSINDVSGSLVGSGAEFSLDNYFSPATPVASSFASAGINKISAIPKALNSVNGPSPGFVRLSGANVEMPAVVAYSGGNGSVNGLAILGAAFQTPLKNASLHHILGISAWTSFNENLSIGINGQPANQLKLSSAGLHSGRMGKSVSGSVSGNNGVNQSVTVIGANYLDSAIAELMSFMIYGSNFDFRCVIACSHNGFGSSGAAVLISTLRNLPVAGVSLSMNFGLDVSGRFVFSVVTDRPLTYTVKNIGISNY